MAAISFVIATYYVVIIAWCLSFIYYSFGQDWGEETGAFFIGDYLATSDGAAPSGFWDIGGLQWKVLLPLAIAWALIGFLMHRGVSRGIEMASRVLMPTPGRDADHHRDPCGHARRAPRSGSTCSSRPTSAGSETRPSGWPPTARCSSR